MHTGKHKEKVRVDQLLNLAKGDSLKALRFFLSWLKTRQLTKKTKCLVKNTKKSIVLTRLHDVITADYPSHTHTHHKYVEIVGYDTSVK